MLRHPHPRRHNQECECFKVGLMCFSSASSVEHRFSPLPRIMLQSMKHPIAIKRAYDAPARSDGTRVLVERLWPRGIRKEQLKFDHWFKEAAPSVGLRKWFNHDASKWSEFKRRYRTELNANPNAWKPILELAREGRVTLLFSSHDSEHNNVVALKLFLEEGG